jgi:hypothetical protein
LKSRRPDSTASRKARRFSSGGHEAAQLYGDDIVPRAAFALVDSGNLAEVLAFFYHGRDTARGLSQEYHDPSHKGGEMILATTTVEDFDRFLKIFSTKGAEKRKQHGSKGATVFRDPNQADRVWVLFDWDMQGFQKFLSDPEVPPIIKEAGHKSKPQAAELGGQYSS